MSVEVRRGGLLRFGTWMAGAIVTGMALVAADTGRAQVIAEQKGNEDPTAPGQPFRWANAGRSTLGKGVDAPEAAWKIVTEKGTPLCYWIEPSQEEVEKAFAQGWRLTARVRLDTEIVPLPQRFSTTFGFESEAKNSEWMVGLVVDESQGLMAEINRTKYPLPGLSVSEYHTYELSYDVASQTVGLAVDGQTIEANIKPVKADKTRIVWGNISVSAASASEWASVKMEILQP